ncbi:ATP-binding protein [Ectopseudomonas mendocina]|uniref:ATP-binding protein n=1 Tax=Ectopseudomonas mendocina TaxID=300 RepID=UPI003F0A6E21
MAVVKDSIEVSFNSDADYLIQGLTSDVSTIECIYDLIDNSIDAARSKILSGPKEVKKDFLGLPASYKGFKIELNISSRKVAVSDNCAGIDENTLSEKVFTIGKRSKHAFGIGHYGVGLNRAIFKLGSSVQLMTDNGKHAFSLGFSEENVRAAVESKSTIRAKRLPTSKKNYYRLEIDGVKSDVLSDLGSDTWLETLRDQIRIRYAIFCGKGLAIVVNKKKVGSFGPKIRNPDFLEKRTKNFVSQNGVSVYLEAGLHENYRIAKFESDYEEFKPVIKGLTPEYGWYVVCNDRIILVADKTKTTGWTTTAWHNEYHGFLGWAYYVSEDPSLLPWDTKKTGINTNNQTHIEVLSSLKELADDYRSRNRSLRQSKSGGLASEPAKPRGNGTGTGTGTSTSGAGSSVRGGSSPGGAVSSGGRNASGSAIHTKEMDMLIYNISAVTSSPRIASFLQEAKEISIKEHPYTAMILLRVLFEAALRDYLLRHKHYQKVKDSVFEEQAVQGRPFNQKQKRDFTPALSNMLSWVVKNTEIFSSDLRRGTKTSIDNFIKDLSRLNGIVHEDGVLTDFSEAKQIRNNALKALETFLGS